MKSNPETALITGAAGGIGQSLVNGFLSSGYAVIGLDREPCPADLQCTGFVQADLEEIVNSEGYAEEIFSRIRTEFGPLKLRVIINNAAVQVLGGLGTLRREDWHSTFNVNTLAPFILTQAFRDELEQNQGCVINVSSIHARLTKNNFVAYSTSKAALSGLTRALAVDAGDKIRVNAIEPAAIATDMLAQGFKDHPEKLEQLAGYHPTNCIGDVDEITKLALMIADEKIKFLNGSCIHIDGGISARLFDPD